MFHVVSADRFRSAPLGAPLAFPLVPPARAQDGLIAYKSLSPDLALELARAALASCRARGFQVAVAVVDRFGVTQVVLRDRFAGPHTVPTATGKAWTAVSFRTSTAELAAMTQAGMPQSGIRALAGVVAVGGGLTIEAGGSTAGGVGVSGAPGATRTRPAPKPGSRRCRDKLEF